jgi:hypothetical protein
METINSKRAGLTLNYLKNKKTRDAQDHLDALN